MGLCYECAEMVIGAGMGWRNKKSLLNSLLYQIGIAEGSIIGPFVLLLNIYESSLAMENFIVPFSDNVNGELKI